MPGSISNASTYYGSNEARGKAILIDETSVTAGTAVIRTVTAGKTYFLISCSLSYHATADDDGCSIYNNLAGNKIMEMQSRITATYYTTDSDHAEMTFPLPIPFPAGDTLEVKSDTANIKAYATIIGWEE